MAVNPPALSSDKAGWSGFVHSLSAPPALCWPDDCVEFTVANLTTAGKYRSSGIVELPLTERSTLQTDLINFNHRSRQQTPLAQSSVLG